MPTGNRKEFVPLAIKSFLSQDYGAKFELVVVDDGNVPCWDVVPELYNEFIRYEYRGRDYGPRMSIGEKRNWGNRSAHGDIIVHWDDDDWYHPSRLRDQIEHLLASGKQVVGYHSIHYYRESDKKTFKYNDPTFRPHGGGTSLVYWKKFWEVHKFPDRQIAEDFIFTTWARNTDQMASKDGLGMVVARVHSKSTCDPKFGTRKFPEVEAHTLPHGFFLDQEARAGAL
jgi:glycosyltransferase involved in cell wall biosynthesis